MFFCICILGLPITLEMRNVYGQQKNTYKRCKKPYPDFVSKFELKIELRIEATIAPWNLSAARFTYSDSYFSES